MASNQRLQHRFLVLRKLGQGTYGKVQLALNKETNQEVAIKTIKKAKIENEEDMLRIRREIHIMTSIRHPHIIHIHEVFETRQKIVIVMQYASGGELYDYLGCHETLPDAEARRLFRQIASAIYYCHKNKICHRDLKLENILLDEQGNAQIADFGLSNIFDDRRRMNTFCGSPLYAPPEIVKGLPYKGPEVDCWSLGVLLYTLIYGTMPFDGRNFKELVTQISEGRYEEPVSKSNASGLIRLLLTPDISRRATINDICKDKWVNEGYEESLLIAAEKMALEAVLKTKNLRVSHLISQPNSTKQSIIQKNAEHRREKHYLTSNGHSDILSSINDQISQKTSLHEQILNYDVSFIINKLLGAVESVLKSSTENNTQMTKLPINELIRPALKSWLQNGENNLATKIDSAYVIPIFEVTSIMPKLSGNVKNLNNKETIKQCNTENSISKGSLAHKLEMHKQKDIKNKELTGKKIETLNLTFETNSETSSNLQKESINSVTMEGNSKNMEISEPSNQSEVKDQCLLGKKNCQDNILNRNPSVKMKKALENQLFGQTHFGLFFRGKNNTLSLARIFSTKYEKRASVKSSVPKKKPPGKIEIPPTFDPSILSTLPTSAEEKKHIVLFPTVSVSENKQKIEKKIEKIKKAALNRNMILRSNSANRLKIQKYLKSFQAKRIQDMVCEEQRSVNNSTEHMVNFPETYFGNLLNAKMHNKKMNFAIENALDFSFQFSGIGTDSNCGFLMLAKSKSDVQFPIHTSNLATAHSNYNKNFHSFLCVPKSDCTTKLSRSASDSQGLNNYKNITMSEINTDEFKILETIPSIKVEMSMQSTSSNGSSEACEKESVYQNEPVIKYFNFSRNGISIEQCKEYLLSLKASYTENGNKELNNVPNIYNMNFYKLDGIDVFHKQHNSSHFSKKTQNYENSHEDDSLHDDVFDTNNRFPMTAETNNCDLKQKSVRRRNTFNCDQDCNDIVMQAIESIRGKSVDNCSEFKDYIRISQSEQELQIFRPKDETKFSSSPNLFGTLTNKKNNFRCFDDNTSITNHNIKSDNLINNIYEYSLGDSSPIQTKEKSDFLKRILQTSDPSSGLSRRFNRTGNSTMGENNYIFNENSESLNERKLSFQQVNKSQFLSKFLNDLENKTNANAVNGNSNLKHYPRNIFAPGKRSKLEKRSKSFLQLLSLKRIQEAEKEIERVERDVKIDEEENAGSLLEALKTHGYKGVLSQRFQEENNSTDAYDLYNSKSPFLRRKFSSELHRFNSTYYDSLKHFTAPTYEVNDLDMINGFSVRPFEMYPDFRQHSQKQFVNDWLAATRENEEIYVSQSVEPDSLYTESYNQNVTKETENESSFVKESSRSFEDETSSSESFDSPKDFSKSTQDIVSNKTRDYVGDSTTLQNYMKGERNKLRRTSSTSEDESRESVQDRIWRKSFYSRFNNSALSRKERSGFIDLSFLPESRAGFSGSPSPFKATYRDVADIIKTNGYEHNPQSKKNHVIKKYTSTNDTGSTDYMKLKPSKSKKSYSGERTESTDVETKYDDTEPEH